ncbi:MAG: thioredoxin family protein [Thermodesulfobacteriota bacterium]
MVLLNSKMVPIGKEAYDFSLIGTDEKTYSLESFIDKKVLVIIFMCNHCPYVKATIGRLIDIQKDYDDKGVQLVGINSNDEINYPDDSFENMKSAFKDKGINFPYLRDDTQDTARKYDAVCTPDIYLYGPERKLLYRGRIDDNWQDETKVTRKDLRGAIDTVLEDRPVSDEQYPSMGCSIKWKSEGN